jgi:hypothetical protein
MHHGCSCAWAGFSKQMIKAKIPGTRSKSVTAFSR